MPSIDDWNAVRTEHHGTKETKIFEQHAESCDYHYLAKKFARANWPFKNVTFRLPQSNFKRH